MGDGRIHPGRIEEVVAKARAEVDLVIRQAGEQAAYECGVPGLPGDLLKTLGRLKFRRHTARMCSSTRSRRATSRR